MMSILIRPVITEKSMYSASFGAFTFEVALGSTKHAVKHAVETAFKVNVVKIHALRRHNPSRTTGSKRIATKQTDQKFMTVWLKKGQSIDLFDLKEAKTEVGTK